MTGKSVWVCLCVTGGGGGRGNKDPLDERVVCIKGKEQGKERAGRPVKGGGFLWRRSAFFTRAQVIGDEERARKERVRRMKERRKQTTSRGRGSGKKIKVKARERESKERERKRTSACGEESQNEKQTRNPTPPYLDRCGAQM